MADNGAILCHFQSCMNRRHLRKIKAPHEPQIRAARGLLRWSAEDLAREAALGLATIRRAEGAENQTSMTAANGLAVRRALEAAGVRHPKRK